MIIVYYTLASISFLETQACTGPNDMRYPAIILGPVKAGYAVRYSTIPWHRPLRTGKLRLLDFLDLAKEQPR